MYDDEMSPLFGEEWNSDAHWRDAFFLENQLTEDERLIRDTAKQCHFQISGAIYICGRIIKYFLNSGL